MRTYSPELIADVLAANDVVDILGAYLELKPAGSNSFKSRCPFHTEKTPSFVVNRNRQSWHCFGCGKGGDAIGFLREYDGLTFVEALRRLADRAGITLPALREQDDKAEYQRKELLEFSRFAAKHFQRLLRDPMRGSVGRQYLKTRELNETTIQRFNLGFAPDDWNCLRDAAVKEGFRETVLEASGLFRRGDRGGFYDFFRNRVMFPIRNTGGDTVAFGGRDLGDSPAKYINSPESAVYRKSRVLYALDQAKQSMRETDTAILVEGYFDVLRCFDAGIENVVATCGTALTPGQATLIRRYVPEITVVYDGDAAGIHAALRGIGILTGAGLRVRLLALPEGQDPDDFIRNEGADAFRKLTAEAADFVTFYVRMSSERTGTIEGRTEVARELFAIIRDMDDQMRIEEYLKLLAEELGLSEWACRREYESFLQRPVSRRQRREKDGKNEDAQKPVSRDDAEFIAALISERALLDLARESMKDITMPEGPLTEVLEPVLAGEDTAMLHRLENPAAQQLYSAAASLEPEPGEELEEMVRKRINRIEQDALRKRARLLQEEIHQAEREKDMNRLAALFTEKVTVEQRIRKLGAA